MNVKNVKYSAYVNISFFVPGHFSDNILWYGLVLFIKENMKQNIYKILVYSNPRRDSTLQTLEVKHPILLDQSP